MGLESAAEFASSRCRAPYCNYNNRRPNVRDPNMPPQASFDDKLAAIRKLRGQSLTAEDTPALRKLIGDRSNFVVAGAAEIAGENTLVELAKELEAAFERFLVDPLKRDKLCRGKIAVVQALDKMEHQRLDVFEKAAKYVQLEPGFGGPSDTAAPLRAAALLGIARIEGSSSVLVLIDAMIDPERDVRIAAAVALGAVGSEAAVCVLRLKARMGDENSEVLSECLSGLLTANPREQLAFVCEFLEPEDEAECEAAALALGKSRMPEAVEPLAGCWQRTQFAEVGQQVLLAMAMLRLPAAIDFLVELLRSDSETAALKALSALKIHNYDARLRERIGAIVDEKGSHTLKLKFDQGFGAEGR
jgi:HEAT repeats